MNFKVSEDADNSLRLCESLFSVTSKPLWFFHFTYLVPATPG